MGSTGDLGEHGNSSKPAHFRKNKELGRVKGFSAARGLPAGTAELHSILVTIFCKAAPHLIESRSVGVVSEHIRDTALGSGRVESPGEKGSVTTN